MKTSSLSVRIAAFIAGDVSSPAVSFHMGVIATVKRRCSSIFHIRNFTSTALLGGQIGRLGSKTSTFKAPGSHRCRISLPPPIAFFPEGPLP